ncbi:MAG: acyl-protein synthetase [Pedosphaera sp.]|nr:acyl-protein synthetase [Pedosphaera sp.]
MSTTEKLRLMETLWSDLSRNEAELPSPAWHEQILREREEKFKTGEEKPIDWETIKVHFRDRTSL